jgi:DNA-binding transcriptional ArsR family regulator
MARTQTAGTPAEAGRTADFFRAAADPTRRALLDLLAEQGPLTVGQLTAHFPSLVPSGISKHLMLLRQLGFVQAIKQGRERRYQLDPQAVGEALQPWISKYERFWDERLQRLRAVAEARQAADQNQ